MCHVTRYTIMPIPPVETQTHYFEAGPIRIGVEYRLLTDAVAAAHMIETAGSNDPAETVALDDRGISLHVFGEQDGEQREFLRFDCFVEDPHYHYVSWRDQTNDMIHIDPVADGDPLQWAVERIRTRLPQMLERSGARELARQLDPVALEEALPRVIEAAFRLRYDHDDAATLEGALAGGSRG
jgi:hypothetical protein